MAQFDVYAGVGRSKIHVVDLQSDALDQLTTRIVAPLVPQAGTHIISTLNPVVEIQGTQFAILMQEMAAVRLRELQRRIDSLQEYQDEIKRALDLVFYGF